MATTPFFVGVYRRLTAFYMMKLQLHLVDGNLADAERVGALDSSGSAIFSKMAAISALWMGMAFDQSGVERYGILFLKWLTY